MLSAGLNYSQKNKVRRMHGRGYSAEEIARHLKCQQGQVQGLINQLSPTADSDKYGPLPDSPEWRELSPGARSGLTRKRQNAAKAE